MVVSRAGISKRSYRHQYIPSIEQGWAWFDLEIQPPDAPVCITSLPLGKNALLFTSKARVFRLNPETIPLSNELRDKGKSILDRSNLIVMRWSNLFCLNARKGILLWPARRVKFAAWGTIYLVSTCAQVLLCINYNEFGPLAAGCWTSGEDELFILTRGGMAIGFMKNLFPLKEFQESVSPAMTWWPPLLRSSPKAASS